MNRFFRRFGSVAQWVWRRTSVGVALLLMVTAAAFGYRLGQAGGDEPPEAGPDPVAASDPAPAFAKTQLYTCSMHPQIRSTDPHGKCPICFMDLIPVAGGAGVSEAPSDRGLTISKAAAARARIETAEVRRWFPTATVRLYGKVTYDETSLARLTAYFPGRIDRLFVNFAGTPIQAGEHVAELFSPELLAAFEELRQAVRVAADAADSADLVRQSGLDTLWAARERLRLFGLTADQIAAVEDGSFTGDRLTVFAPIGGVVTHLAVREGDYVQTGAEIATVADLSRLWLDLQAYESQLPMLRWGQDVTFTVAARPGDTYTGRVSFIEPIVNDRMRTATVRVAVDNADGLLTPGMFATAEARVPLGADGPISTGAFVNTWVCPMHPTVVADGPRACDLCGMDLVPARALGLGDNAESATAPLVIPRSAVLFTGVRSVVYVMTDGAAGPEYTLREVTLGPRAGEEYIVRDGLREHESVVVNGAFRIDSAMQIAGHPSMMSPEGGAGAGGHMSMPGMRTTQTITGARSTAAIAASLTPVYNAYFEAQEALAADDAARYAHARNALRDAFAQGGADRMDAPAAGDLDRIAAALRTDDIALTLDAARSEFQSVSAGIVALVERYGHAGSQPWRLAHCPMAFDQAGADWLQRGEEINNPYFGAAMLRCGEFRATFPASSAEAGGSALPDGEQP